MKIAFPWTQSPEDTCLFQRESFSPDEAAVYFFFEGSAWLTWDPWAGIWLHIESKQAAMAAADEIAYRRGWYLL